MRIEIDTLEELGEHLANGGDLRRTVVQGLDLRNHTDTITEAPVAGAVFLGCELAQTAKEHIVATGGLLFPRLPDLPFCSYRPSLYDADELMAGYRRGEPSSYADTRDQAIYRYYDDLRRRPEPVPILDALAQRLHDHAIDNALDELLHGDEPARVVAIMGGHAMKRTDSAYRTVARVAQILAANGFLMASGGGPGAMEATHLGAWLGACDEAALDHALELLAPAPSYKSEGWLDTAFHVRDEFAAPLTSIGIPTWFYGHEPPNIFATHIAKYFSNSLREDGLLAIARHGVVYSPGSAGTIQEIFMDAAQNHYGTFDVVSPMVFLDLGYWTESKPVYPVLQHLAADRQYGDMLAAFDDADSIANYIMSHPPVPYRGS